MKVIILSGGYGTRIRDVSEEIPKPMIPIGGRPILWHIMKYYAEYGHKEFVLCLGYKGDVIRNFFLNYEKYMSDITIEYGENKNITTHSNYHHMDWKVTLAETGLNSMTGGRLSQIKKYVQEDTFFITYGDGLGNINLDELLKFHKSHGRILTVTGVHPPGRFGELRAGNDGVVTEFNEKPQSEAGRISGGFFVADSRLFDYLTNDLSEVFEDHPMRTLVKEKKLMMFKHDGFWQPMDTAREYQLLNKLYLEGSAPWLK
jgi:glucose-1-phosphate cytidylyltransferase